MAGNMTRRARLIILICGVCAILAAAILPWWWNRPQVYVPPLPSEEAEVKAKEETRKAVESEIDCIDRVIAEGPNPDGDPAAAFARCREQAAPATRGNGMLAPAPPPPPEELRNGG
jgi:hypothetical protein